ncbi:hypothetical protein GUJ93_ZPchr0001g32183 [Zizania palustris]|uniref:Uncharacterized protein n=1 Tax=Zizania palustris TaxID=103762 RepID=A0A8J5V6I9_ZIZPA|nr:hypothetical protein GUJ93_ZPchr0001g32183 [Zizania palustris]
MRHCRSDRLHYDGVATITWYDPSTSGVTVRASLVRPPMLRQSNRFRTGGPLRIACRRPSDRPFASHIKGLWNPSPSHPFGPTSNPTPVRPTVCRGFGSPSLHALYPLT